MPHEMSKWETSEFQRPTLTLRDQMRSSTRQPSHHHPVRRQMARSRRMERYRKMTYRGRTTPAKASLTRFRLRHKRSLRRSAAADVADVAAHAIDGKKNARGTSPRLVSLVVSACWVLVRTSVAGGDTDGVEVDGGGEGFHRGSRGHGESRAARCMLPKSWRSASSGSVQSDPIPHRRSWPEASPA